MVSKKFRCAAPASHSWDERAANLLYSLDGDVKKREKLVKQTLEALKNHVEEKKRVGPGRKSHAENALAFYRYCLSLGEADSTLPPRRMKPKSNDEAEPDDEEESVNEEEFLAQHNDLCEVCNEGGELLCCSTCNLVFHLSCHKPEIKSEPPDDWSCAYCISSGVTGHKREARIRKRAQQCVRDMTRIKEELEGRKKRAEASKPASDGSIEEHKDDLSQVAVPNQKPSEAVGPSVSHGSGKPDESASKDEEDGEGRSRRTRKAPILYVPQTGADSKWKTDGHREWGTVSRSERKQRTSPKEKEEKNDEEDDEVWCNFCKDDPNVLLCCFCACRVCFGKHDGARLLICDNCDSEYHTYCLTPPLSSVPKKKKWYCPSCSPKKKDKIDSPRKPRAASVVKKPPPAVVTTPRRSLSSSTDPDKRSSSRSRSKPARFNSPTNIPKQLPKQAPSSSKAGSPPTPKKRGPGRPRKHPLPEDRVLPVAKKAKTESKGSETRLKRSSSREARAESKPENSRSRPISGQGTPLGTSDEAGSSKHLEKVSKPLLAHPTQRSQSGRAVKRKTFHDEIPEGAQLLKSTPSVSRSAMGPPAKKTATVDAAKVAASQSNGTVQAAVVAVPGPSKNQLSVTLPIPKPVPPPGRGDLSPASTPTTSNLQTQKLVTPISRPVSTSQAASRTPTQTPAYSMGAITYYQNSESRVPRRKPGARECMQISRRFGVQVIPSKYMEILLDYCSRGKVEHLIRMRERLDDHSRFLESQLAGLESLVKEKGECDVVVPTAVVEDGTEASNTSPQMNM